MQNNLTTATINSGFLPQLKFLKVLFSTVLPIKLITLRWLTFLLYVRLFIKPYLQNKRMPWNACWNIRLPSLLPDFNTTEDTSVSTESPEHFSKDAASSETKINACLYCVELRPKLLGLKIRQWCRGKQGYAVCRYLWPRLPVSLPPMD